MLQQLHLHVVDICVVDRHSKRGLLATQVREASAVIHENHGHAWLCTTFDPYKVNDADFATQAVRQLNQNFADGAVAVKIWKNVGMEIQRPDGKYVMPDDPVFAPIYRDIAAHHKTLIAHLAEPDSCWLPPNPASPDYSYYNENPQWYMYRHPERPSKATILAARDHLLAEYPQLRVVGAHLGSMETDVDRIARRFDRYPNFAVDTAARVPYLMLQPRAKVRAFLIKYQDRILYGTDLELLPGENAPQKLKWWRESYARDWRYFATDAVIDYNGHKVRGLALPAPVLHKIFHDNAVRWIPGVMGTGK
jgi:predicted TIM-barrel fold metal-dependent hydrolase